MKPTLLNNIMPSTVVVVREWHVIEPSPSTETQEEQQIPT